MKWSNENALEFLELLQTEDCLWDPRKQSFKSRSAQSDAWHRIVEALSFPTTIDEMKKKKESLMGYYRIHLNKYKKSLKSGTDVNDLYKTNWFAFDLMHSFLKPIYDANGTINIKTGATTSTDTFDEKGSITTSDRDNRNERTSHEYVIDDEPPPITRQTTKRKTFKHAFNRNSEIKEAKQQMDEALDVLKNIASKKRKDYDEYDHFAFSLAAKIRNIPDVYDREILMNSLQNLAFEFVMKLHRPVTIPVQAIGRSRYPPGVVLQTANIPCSSIEQYTNSGPESDTSSVCSVEIKTEQHTLPDINS